ncbi:MAG TPA: NADH-quinone oxidoreductase subunit N, partial [Phycisphaerae bacterium]|nr:NADH-quinone oxidoreductase subunit N [Phycisphaerae bacterium]
MDLSAYIGALLPEFILLVGACIVLLAGSAPVSRDSRGGSNVTGPLALITVIVAFGVSWLAGRPVAHPVTHISGLLLTPMTYYVRLGGLFVGGLIVLCNLHLPVARERAEYFAMILFSLLGLLVTAAANDLVVLFFAIELVSVPTYILISLSREDRRASESAIKYFFLGAFAAGIMLYGFSFLYGTLGGTTTMIATAQSAGMSGVAGALAGKSTLVTIGLLLALAGLFFKMAAVPFHVYAADVYEGAASPVTGLLGFLPKFAGFVAAAKLLAVFNWDAARLETVYWVLWIVAALTMTLGNTLALLQTNVKRILAYSSIAHSGYMLIGLIVGPALVGEGGPMRDGVAAMLFYMVVYGTMNLGAFAVLSAVARRGEPVEELRDLTGMGVRRPLLSLAMAVCMFSLMGFPPTAGLLGKVYIFASAFSAGDMHPFGHALVVLAVIGVINSAIGAAYYLRIVATCYNKAPADDVP